MLQYRELVASLGRAGLGAGDVALVQSDLLQIGPVDAGRDREAILDFYLSAFEEVLTSDGTLTVLTAFEDYGRSGKPFDREGSPSLSGAFSEYVRTRPGAIRSIHPIASVTGLGAKAEEICGGPHYDGYGYDSPWGRLHRANAKLLTLGYGIRPDGMTFLHYAEALLGAPYLYTKIFGSPVISGGEQVPGPFTMSVRYLDFGIRQDQSKFKRHLVDTGVARSVPLGRGHLLSTTCGPVVEQAAQCMREDRYFFLERKPAFRPGEIPTDGPTEPMTSGSSDGTFGY